MRITFQLVSGLTDHGLASPCKRSSPAADGRQLQVRQIVGGTAARGVLTRLYPEVVCTHRHTLPVRALLMRPIKATGGALARTDGATALAASAG